MNTSWVQVGKRAGGLGRWQSAARWDCAVFVVGFKGRTEETKMLQGPIEPDTEGVGDFVLTKYSWIHNLIDVGGGKELMIPAWTTDEVFVAGSICATFNYRKTGRARLPSR